MSSRPRPILAIAITLAALVQVGGFVLLEPKTFDSAEYLALGESLFRGHVYAAPKGLNGFIDFPGESPTRMRQPGYPLFLLVTYWWVGQNLWIPRVTQMMLNLAALVLTYLAAHRALGSRFWTKGILLPAVYFPWLWTSALILTESLFTAMLALSVYSLARACQVEYRWRWIIVLGLCLGALALVRPLGLVMGACVIFPFLSCHGVPKGLRSWVVSAACMMCVLGPWTIRNMHVWQEPTPISTEAGYNLWVSSLGDREPVWQSHPQFQEATRSHYYIDRVADDRFKKFARENIMKSPLKFLERGLVRTAKLWLRFPGSGKMDAALLASGLSLLQALLVLMMVIGLFTIPMGSRWILGFPTLAVIAVQPFSFPVTRYLLPVAPLCLVLSAQGIKFVILHARRRGHGASTIC